MPDILKKREWEYPMSANLSSWANLLDERRHDISITTIEDDFEEMFQSMHDIHLILTDRFGVDAGRIRYILERIYRLVCLLEQADHVPGLLALVREGNRWLGYLEGEVECLRAVTERDVKEIEAKREELDGKEARVRREGEEKAERIKMNAIEGLLQCV